MLLVFLKRPDKGWPSTRRMWLDALFATRTGQRLKYIIGDTECEIQNLMPFGANPELADQGFIGSRLFTVQPHLVLALSAEATDLLPSLWKGPLICTRHLNSRYMVDGDPLFVALKRKVESNFSGRVWMNRDRSNRIVEVPL